MEWKGVHQWEALGFNIRLPKVEYFFDHSIMIPIWHYLTDEDIEYIADNVCSFYKR